MQNLKGKPIFRILLVSILVLAGGLLVWGGVNAWRAYQQAQINDQLARAQQFFDQGGYQAALKVYQSAGADNEKIRLNLAEIYLRLGRVDSAQAQLDKISNSDLERKKGLEEIIKLYNQGIAVPQDTYQQAKKARELLQKNYTLLAIQLLQQTTNRSPDYRDARLLLGTAYFKNGQAQKALQELEQAADIDPAYPVTFKLMAQIYESLGKTQTAEQLKEKAQILERP